MSEQRSLYEVAQIFWRRALTAGRNIGLPFSPAAYLVYHEDYHPPLADGGPRLSHARHRAAKILNQLLKVRLLSAREVLEAPLATRAQLELVHPPEYLDDISRSEPLKQLLFQQPELIIDEGALWNYFLRQTGGTILALQTAVARRQFVFNLGGGFHHAQRDHAEAFCPINDIAVAVRFMQQQGLASRVLIIDLDFHHGNGTALIFSSDPNVFTFSMHGQEWSRIDDRQRNLDIELPSSTGDRQYLLMLRRALDEILRQFHPDVAVYVAGADAYCEDELGGFALSEEGLLDRDLFVYHTLRQRDIPCAVVLGGGYSEFSWAITYNFICSVLSGQRIPREFRPSNITAQYRRRHESLEAATLQSGEYPLSEKDLPTLLGETSTPRAETSSGLLGAEQPRFLNYYTTLGFQLALEHYGFMDLLRERGFAHPLVSLNTTDPQKHILRIHDGHQKNEKHLLVELVTSYKTLFSPEEEVSAGAPESFRLVSIDWLMMQNPRRDFSLARPPLPGQQRPGLGVGRFLIELLRLMAQRLDVDGLMNTPQHYHNAFLYSKQMLFFSPDRQGWFEALRRDLHGLELVKASQAIDDGRLRDYHTGEKIDWDGPPQVMPIKPELNQHFARPAYIAAVTAARERYRFVLDK